jgi:hypothetical protein
MRGLKTQETEKFNRFFAFVQREALANGFVFFLYAGEGREIETVDIEGEDLSGWLIPLEDAEDFERIWLNASLTDGLDNWADFFTFVTWNNDEEGLSVKFRRY